MTQSDLVGPSHFTLAAQGVARMLSEDFAVYDDAVGAYPYLGPNERSPTRIGELFRLHGGVTVVDSGDLDGVLVAMPKAPGVLVAFDGLPSVLLTSPGRHPNMQFGFRITLKTDPVDDRNKTKARRADIVGAITARLTANRYQLGAGCIPLPADIDPWGGPNSGDPPLTRKLSHGILSATSVGPPSRLPGEGGILRDDFEAVFAANMILQDDGRWRIQE